MTTYLNPAALLLLCFLLISCTAQPVATSVSEYKIPLPAHLLAQKEQPSQHYWWYASFKLVWTEEYDTLDFSNNLIIADQIIRPVLETHREAIKLWRFHRRADDDSAGHQFSFIFYATASTARQIFQQIDNNSLSQQLLSEKIVEQIKLDNPNKPRRPNIEDVSDKSWSLSIQKSWPYYIMGVSILWFDMLNQEIARENIDTSRSIQTQMMRYKDINEAITQHWKEQGKHAFFHHISGVFGYEPLELHF